MSVGSTSIVAEMLRGGSALAILAVIVSPALAQEQTAPSQTAVASDRLDSSGDIVVTARRREESLQDVPVSIVAFSQTQITENAVASAADLGRVSPGLLSYPGAAGLPTQNSFSIRGRGLTFGAAAGSVETYFAEVPLSSNYNMPELPPQFFDLASVQVLKGPQGTLFGRSTTGGAVLIQPAAPTNDWAGYGRVQLGNYNNLQVEGAVNIPVIDDVLAIRLAGQHWKRDGYMTAQTYLPDDVRARLATDPGYVGRLGGRGARYINGQVVDPVGRVLVNRDGAVISSSTGLPIQRTKFNNRDTTDLRGTIRLTPGDRFENSTIVTYHRDRNLGGLTGGLLLLRNAQGVAIGGEPAPGAGTYNSYVSISPSHPKNEASAIINTTGYELADGLKLVPIRKRPVSDDLEAYDCSGRAGFRPGSMRGSPFREDCSAAVLRISAEALRRDSSGRPRKRGSRFSHAVGSVFRGYGEQSRAKRDRLYATTDDQTYDLK